MILKHTGIDTETIELKHRYGYSRYANRSDNALHLFSDGEKFSVFTSDSYYKPDYNKDTVKVPVKGYILVLKDGKLWRVECKAETVCYRSTTYNEAIVIAKETLNPSFFEREATMEDVADLLSNEKMLYSNTSIEDVLKKQNPFVYKWAKEEFAGKGPDEYMLILILLPYTEVLYKAGYEFAKQLLNYSRYWRTKGFIQKYLRATQPGTKPSQILGKINKDLIPYIKNVKLDQLDSYRIMVNKGESIANIIALKDANLSERDLRFVKSIVGREWNGKKIFTIESLVNYLDRVDMNEAIERWEALQLLDDYLLNCQRIGYEPRVDGDSLKREHDVVARLNRQYINKQEDEKMQHACKELAKYNYENEKFIIRAVIDGNDLRQEANMQHNCVAGYASRIARGESLIFFLRRKDNPNHSLVTIELSPDFRIRQKLKAYNQPINDSEITELIESWAKNLRDNNIDKEDK